MIQKDDCGHANERTQKDWSWKKIDGEDSRVASDPYGKRLFKPY